MSNYTELLVNVQYLIYWSMIICISENNSDIYFTLQKSLKMFHCLNFSLEIKTYNLVGLFPLQLLYNSFNKTIVNYTFTMTLNKWKFDSRKFYLLF